ncbi:MAG: N-acetyl-gamma-glutamyl-phosphate reductase, partial [Myxococcota bacterium]
RAGESVDDDPLRLDTPRRQERGRIVVFSALDSIGKGGAHVGIENVNMMLGLPRTLGLERRGLHPH